MGTLNIPYITIDDSSATQADTSFLNTSNITTMINGTTTGASRDCVWRFQVPVSTVIADITAAKIKVQAYSAGTFYGSVGVTANTNSATSATTPNKPSEIWSNRINASSVTWNQSTTTSNFQFIESADFVTQLKAALTATTAVGGFYNISVVWHGTVQSSPTGSVQVYTLEHTTQAAYAGTLILSSEVPSFTQSVSPVALAPATGNLVVRSGQTIFYPLVSNIVLYRLQEDQTSYHDGTVGSSSVKRTFNLFSSANTAPLGGYPVIVWVHGGSFAGGNNTPNTYMIQACLRKGYAIAAPWYKVIDGVAPNSTGSYPHPHAIQDIICFTKHIIDNKLTYKINTDNLIGTGESAGGHIILDAALCLDDPNIDSYDMAYNPTSQPNRSADYPNLNITEGRNITGISYKAIFSWVGPVNIERTKALTLLSGGLTGNAVLAYLGMDAGGSMAAVKGEGDLDSYIIGKLRPNYFNIQGIINNTQNIGVYESKEPTKPSFPIGYAAMVDDDTVPNAAGLSPLIAALVNLPYEICDYSSTTGKISKNGLTFKRTCYGSPAGGLTFNLPNENNIYQNYTFVSATGSGQGFGASHGAAMLYRPNITFFLEWLQAIWPTINDEPILDYTSIGNRNHIIPKQVAKAFNGGFVANPEVGQTWPRNGPRHYGT